MRFEELFETARWMTPDQACATPCCRAEFTLEKGDLAEAELTICGLGFFEARLNGHDVSKDLFVPPSTNYYPRDMIVNGRPFAERMASRILCPRYEVAALLRPGKNVLAVRLGPGYYSYDHTTPFGPVCLCFRLALRWRDGRGQTVLSGDGLRWHESEVVLSEFTRGEEQDYTKAPLDWDAPECAADGWRPMRPLELPETVYDIMTNPADRVVRTLTPALIGQEGERRVYDVGLNTAGRPLVRCDSPVPCDVTLRAAEERTPDGRLDEDSVRALYGQHLKVHTDGVPRTVTTRFTWLAGRYFEVTGPAELIWFEVIHADVRPDAGFVCADPVLNWTHDAYLNTQLTNMHGGIPSDCPHIERRGYTGDGELVGETAMSLFDAESFYRKWLDDISDCQDRVSGHVQYTAPYVPSGGGPGGWGCAIVEVPYVFGLVYGDAGPREKMYGQMLHYFDYLDAHSRDGVVTSDEPDCWCLGDWCTARPIRLPEPYINTYFYAKSLRRVLRFCPPQDRPMLEKRLSVCLDAIRRHYWNENTGSFCGGVQGADAFAVDLGLGDERTLRNLVAQYTELGGYDTGIFGTDVLTRVLFEHGEGELAYRLLAGHGEFSFANWMKQGATTLWEYWTGDRSHNHPMFGAVVRYFYQYILGIRPMADETGLGSADALLVVEPARLAELPFARGCQRTMCGRVAVDWAHVDDRFQITVELEQPVRAVLRWNGGENVLHGGINRFDLLY